MKCCVVDKKHQRKVVELPASPRVGEYIEVFDSELAFPIIRIVWATGEFQRRNPFVNPVIEIDGTFPPEKGPRS